MREERNALWSEVVPQLKEFCADLDLDFQLVDLRWGLTEDVQNDHSAKKLCLLEIENCQNVSLGPNFIVSTILFGKVQSLFYSASGDLELDGGARCISVVRAFAHGAMGLRIDPSWWTQ